jgi:predicted metallopeptidase
MKKMRSKVEIDDKLMKLIVDEIDRKIISPHVDENPMVLLIRKNDSIYSKDTNKVMSANLIKEALTSCLYFSDVVAEQIVRLSLNNNIIIGIHNILSTPYTQFKLAALEVILSFMYKEKVVELNTYDKIIAKVKNYRTVNLKTDNYKDV